MAIFTRTDGICDTRSGESLIDCSSHQHIQGPKHVLLGDGCVCPTPTPVDEMQLCSAFVYSRCAVCRQTL